MGDGRASSGDPIVEEIGTGAGPRGSGGPADSGPGGPADAYAGESAALASGGQSLLEVRELAKDFGPVHAVRGLSFDVRAGEIVGLLGPNGAGKTTAMRMLVGYLVPTRGTVRLRGGDVFREGPRLKAQLGYLPENIPLYGEMTVQEYLGMAARLKGLSGEARRSSIVGAVQMLGLEGMWRRPASQLSRGYRQRVGLAQCILGDPQLLILDEPATGLDPNQIAEFRIQLRNWRSRKGILLSTHILAEALMLCDRVLILSRGRLAASGTPQGLMGPDEGPISTRVTVRAGAVAWAKPARGEVAPRLPEGGPALGSDGPVLDAGPLGDLATPLPARAEREAASGPREAVWHIEGPLDRRQRIGLMRHLAAGGWEIVEWNTGLSALEQVFRRVTLEGDQDRAGEE